MVDSLHRQRRYCHAFIYSGSPDIFVFFFVAHFECVPLCNQGKKNSVTLTSSTYTLPTQCDPSFAVRDSEAAVLSEPIQLML